MPKTSLYSSRRGSSGNHSSLNMDFIEEKYSKPTFRHYVIIILVLTLLSSLESIVEWML